VHIFLIQALNNKESKVEPRGIVESMRKVEGNVPKMQTQESVDDKQLLI
jgi:hypothetical protein